MELEEEYWCKWIRSIYYSSNGTRRMYYSSNGARRIYHSSDSIAFFVELDEDVCGVNGIRMESEHNDAL